MIEQQRWRIYAPDVGENKLYTDFTIEQIEADNGYLAFLAAGGTFTTHGSPSGAWQEGVVRKYLPTRALSKDHESGWVDGPEEAAHILLTDTYALLRWMSAKLIKLGLPGVVVDKMPPEDEALAA